MKRFCLMYAIKVSRSDIQSLPVNSFPCHAKFRHANNSAAEESLGCDAARVGGGGFGGSGSATRAYCRSAKARLQAADGFLDPGARGGDVEAQEALAAGAEGGAVARGDAGVASRPAR